MTRTRTLLLVLAAVSVAPLASSAAPITVPSGLNPGDKYRLAFVTSTTRDATSTNIADYNAFVSAVAAGQPELAALATTWTAIASTATSGVKQNTDTDPNVSTGFPIYQLDDTLVADDNADLWDGLGNSPLRTSEDGTIHYSDGHEIWTGTNSAGSTAGSTALGGTSGDARVGTLGSLGTAWINSFTNHPQNTLRPMYAISAELTVVPEPSTLALAAFGVVALAAWGWRRKRSIR